MNGSGDQVLAGSAFTQDEDRRRQIGDLLDHGHDLTHDLAGPQHELSFVLIGDLGSQRDHATTEVLALQRIAHKRPKSVVVEFLVDVVVGPILDRLDGDLDLVDGRHHDDLDLVVMVADDLENLEAAHAGHPDVEQHEV